MSTPERERRLVSSSATPWRPTGATTTTRPGGCCTRRPRRAGPTPGASGRPRCRTCSWSFLEFGADADLREDPAALAAIMALHEAFGDPYPLPKTLEEWIEIPTPDPELP